ncbi:unnamed protein product [marine sediment metagenome]|uniref:Oligopeptide transport permease C-like N-terminal domain-containing protein n=1 Tax=marine sediment metagenome TaxID=412755 RepID=X1B0F7_9ZZZZ
MQKGSSRPGELSKRWENIRRNWYKFSRNSLSIIGLVVVCIIVFVAIFAPYISPHPESAGKFINFYEASQCPSLIHLCGTDVFGRDVLTRIFFGYRFSLMMGIVVLSLVVPVGVVLEYHRDFLPPNLLEFCLPHLQNIFALK